ncbi:hypothetical protein DPEC_G00303190 [Dallia pectoralis]|uniref:Uncharacterized protein n=1 Tax=Dallia pectoralis TaxID=75939 RepID=A0ACC2FD87_DALPE|nr:hypothetical protein DPEC_G00303190 [Dallia pectoralis]
MMGPTTRTLLRPRSYRLPHQMTPIQTLRQSPKVPTLTPDTSMPGYPHRLVYPARHQEVTRGRFLATKDPGVGGSRSNGWSGWSVVDAICYGKTTPRQQLTLCQIRF